MHYDINVSLHGKHLFATDRRSLTTRAECRLLYKLFCVKFPSEEGYKVTATEWTTTGVELEHYELLCQPKGEVS